MTNKRVYTLDQLRRIYLQQEYDDIYPFDEFLRICEQNGQYKGEKNERAKNT